LSVTCSGSVLFSGYSINKTDRHDIILMKPILKCLINVFSIFTYTYIQALAQSLYRQLHDVAEILLKYGITVTCSGSVLFSGYSINKTDRHDIAKILLKVLINTNNQLYPTGPHDCVPVFKPSEHKLYILRHCTTIVYLYC
jgi:hypothetical protein